jgi:site-specific recombinase XerD
MQESKGTLVPHPSGEHILGYAVRQPEIQCVLHGQWAVATAEGLDCLADEFDRNSVAKNTRRSYVSDWASWLAFCECHRINPLPAHPADVRRYLTQLGAVGGRKGTKLRPKSAQRHLAAIAAAHRAAGLEFDTQHPIIKRTMAGILRRYGARQQVARALRAADIGAMCRNLSFDLRSVRNKAIILLGFAGGFRRSEMVALNVTDLAFEDGVVRVTLRRSKTDQEGEGRTIVIMRGEKPETCAVAAVRAWLKAADIEYEGETPAFRPVGRGGVEFTRLCDRTVDRIVKSAVRAAGLKNSYSAHSLRAGHVTEALARGADRASIKRQTGHQSDAMLDRYARETDLAANNSSSSLGL